MANRSAAALVLRDGDRAELERRVRSGTGVASTAQRARIVLLAADGVANCVIRGAGRGEPSDGESVAGPVCRARSGRAGRPAASGPAPGGGAGEADRGNADPAAEELGRDALVVAAARGPARGG